MLKIRFFNYSNKCKCSYVFLDSSHYMKELEEKTAELEYVKQELKNKLSELNNFKRMHEESSLKLVDIESVKEKLQKELNSEVESKYIS